MVDRIDLQRLINALCAEHLAPRVGHIGWALQRLAARFATLDDPTRTHLEQPLRDVEPTVRSLADRCERVETLEARDLRDLRTLWQRLATTLDHVATHPEPLDGEALTVRYARLDVGLALRHACSVFAPLAEARRVEYDIDVDEGLVAELDREKLELAVGNALFNAFKYAPAEGRVRCAATIDDSLDEVVITIEDTGPEIPPAHLDAIFDRTRVADRSVAIVVNDVRLSLGLSRDVMALQGGSLEAVPTPTSDALFEIRLPRWAPRGTTVAAQPPPAAPWLKSAAEVAERELRTEAELGERPVAIDGRSVVLVIASSRALNRALIDCLEPENATASAFDGETGLALAESLRPDLVVVDVSGPQIDVETVIRRLRDNEDINTSILALTSHRDERLIVRLLDAGVHDTLSKPVLLAELRARAGRLLAAKRTTDVLSETIGQRDTDLISLANEVADTHHNLERAYVDLQAARERAERLSQAKSNFLRIMSHELKTPITAMRLQLTVLGRDPTIARGEVLDRGLERLTRSTARLLHLVDTVLEWARINDGRYRPRTTPFDIAELVAEATREVHDRAANRNIEIVVTQTESVQLRNDAHLARLVLVSLLDRAISVSSEGTIEVDVGRGMTGSRVRVRDHGPPLSEQQRDEAFDPLRQGDVQHRTGAGSGLGVYAVCDLARAVGGEISYERDDRPGNVFVFDVPAFAPAAASSTPVPA